jgi:hypothetical protein
VALALSGAVTARSALGRHTRAAREEWPHLHPFEGRQHMSTDTEVAPQVDPIISAAHDLTASGWSQEKVLDLFLELDREGTGGRITRALTAYVAESKAAPHVSHSA